MRFPDIYNRLMNPFRAYAKPVKNTADSGFRFGRKSKSELKGVDADVVEAATLALSLSEQDYAVHDGLRTLAEQKELVRRRVSRTMNSRHLSGEAIDLVPMTPKGLRWEWPLCIKVAQAMHKACTKLRMPMTWGGVWDRDIRDLDINDLRGEMDAYAERYKERRRAAGKKPRNPFLDGPHFQKRP